MASGDEELLSDAKPAIDEVDLRRTADAVKQRLFDAPAAPVRLGRFVLIDRLGAGRMGVAYSAYDPKLDRKVAVKLIRRELVDADRLADRQQRLQREARAMARINHPNVIAVHDVGEHEGQVFIAMELVHGVTLRDWLDTERSVFEIIELFVLVGEGLAAAHAAGVIHRDFKPDNILVDEAGRPRIGDFGLSTSSDGESLADEAPVSRTRDGSIVGTPSYMAPEQLAGRPADERSDQFGYCVTLYEALAGARPFAGDTVAELATSIRDAPAELQRKGVPGRVRRAVASGLAANPEQRHDSMAQLCEQLVPPRNRAGMLVGGGFVAMLVAVVLVLRSSGPAPAGASACDAGDAQIAAVWTADKQAAVHAAIKRHGASFAGQTWSRVKAGIDAFRGDWVRMHKASCTATRVHGTQSDSLFDVRSQCLARRRAELRAAVDVLATADAALVRGAVKLTAALTPVATCANITALSAPRPLPDDPERARQARKLGHELASHRVKLAAGKAKQLVAPVTALVDRAASPGHRPTLAEAELLAGRVFVAAGHKDKARGLLLRALHSGQASGHATVVARAATELLGVAAKDQKKVAWGRIWVGLAEAASERVGRPMTLEAHRMSVWATLLHNAGAVKPAKRQLVRAFEVMTKAHATTTPRFANLVHNLANVYHSLGDYANSRKHIEFALALRMKLLGAAHPDVAATLNTLAILTEATGQLAKARDHYQRAVGIAEAALGKQHPVVGTYLDNLAGVVNKLGDLKTALSMRKRALRIREKRWGKDHPRVAVSLNNMGAMLFSAGRARDALPLYRRSLAIRRSKLGGSHPDVAATLVNLGECEAHVGDKAQGLKHLREALAIVVAKMSADHPELGYYYLALGRVQLAHETPQAAIASLERSLAIAIKANMYKGELNDARFALARALRAAKLHGVRAIKLAEQAAAYYRGAKRTRKHAAVAAWLKANRAPN